MNAQLVRPDIGASALTGPGCFSTGIDSPVRLASVTRKSRPLRIMPSAGTRLPAESSTTSPGTISLANDRPNRTVAQHAHGECQPLAQLRDRGRRSILLREAEKRAAEHDGEDDRGIDPVANEEGDRRAKDEDQDQRARELVEQQPDRRDVTLFLDGIRSVAQEAVGGLGRGKALRTRAKSGEQVRRIATPERVGVQRPWPVPIIFGHQRSNDGRLHEDATLAAAAPGIQVEVGEEIVACHSVHPAKAEGHGKYRQRNRPDAPRRPLFHEDLHAAAVGHDRRDVVVDSQRGLPGCTWQPGNKFRTRAAHLSIHARRIRHAFYPPAIGGHIASASPERNGCVARVSGGM